MIQGNNAMRIMSTIWSYMSIKVVVLLIASTLWLWSNLGVGLICLTICSIAFSIHECFESNQQDDGEESKERYWSKYLLVRCIFRYVIGIMWMWSHKELLLNLSPAVAIFICVVVSICVIVHVVARSRDIDSDDEIWQEYDEKESLISTLKWMETPCNFLIMVAAIGCLSYGIINNISATFWVSVGRSVPFSIQFQSSTTRLDSRDNMMQGSWEAMIGQNVNVNGTQTIGSDTIGERNYIFKINGGRDVIFNAFITPSDYCRKF